MPDDLDPSQTQTEYPLEDAAPVEDAAESSARSHAAPTVTVDDAIEPVADAPAEAAEPSSQSPDLEWLLEHSASLERERADLRRQLQELQSSRTPEQTTQRVAENTPQKSGETRDEWETRVESIVQKQLEASIKPLNEFVRQQGERAEQGDANTRTADVLDKTKRILSYLGEHLDYAKDDPEVAARVSEQVMAEMAQWRAANGRAADRSATPPDYFAMARDRYRHLLEHYVWHHGHIQSKSATTAKKRAAGVHVPSPSGKARPVGAGAPRGDMNYAAGEDIDAGREFLRKHGIKP